MSEILGLTVQVPDAEVVEQDLEEFATYFLGGDR